MFRLGQDCKFHPDIPPANDTTAAANNGAGVARGDYSHVCAVAMAGVIGTACASDLKLQGSDDNSNWADITGAAGTQLTATDDNKIQVVDARLSKKYVRCVQTVTGTAGVLVGVTLILYNPVNMPVVNDPVAVTV